MKYRNLTELLRCQAERLGPRPAIRYKRDGLYHDRSWDDYRSAALACAAALVNAGIQPGDRVGLLSENRAEWLMADMGILAAGAVAVTPHAPLAAAQIQFQLADAGARWLFVSTREQLAKVQQIRSQLPALQGIVVFDRDALESKDAEITWWSGFLVNGRAALPFQVAELDRREKQLNPEDLAALIYTSGTTANPKGVMLTHANFLTNAAAMDAALPRSPDDLVLGWLPLSHIYARTVDHYCSIYSGVTLALAESAETVVQSMQEVQPTHISCVPRFYEKVLGMVGNPDPAVTSKRLRAVFGPRLNWLGSGGAPLPCPIAQAFHAAGFNVLQGYGLTETSPVLAFNRKEHFKLTTVGQAIDGVELAIAADGEILTRGPQIMKGYWNDPEATREAMRDGWFHTGDLGSIDAEGFLTITGRKKDMLVLSNGKKVVPTQIEGMLLSRPCIDQAVVYGEGRNFLTALIVPNWAVVRKALPPDLPAQTEDALARSPVVKQLIDREIQAALKDLANWEQVKSFVIMPRPFSVAAEELTVSMKVRRNVVFEKYRKQLDSLYVGTTHDGASD